MSEIVIPASVPKSLEKEFVKNYEAITKKTDKLFLFAGDQKFGHLNEAFYGEDIPPEVNDPEHLFKIASKGEVGAFATQLGLISRYGKKYPDVNYVVKLNSKTNFIPLHERGPFSRLLWTVEDVVEFKKNSGLNICGIGKTIYIGSDFEADTLRYQEQMVYKAQKNGLVAILWAYALGKDVEYPRAKENIAGVAGIALCIGADFAKMKPTKYPNDLKQATVAAGNTGIICAGGEKIDERDFFERLYAQIHEGGTRGVAAGRNVFQRTLNDAIAFTKAISAIVYKNKTVDAAMEIYEKNK